MEAVNPPTPIIAALPTPFDSDLRLDFDAFTQMINDLGTEADVLVAGTTGEFPAIDQGERADLFNLSAQVLGPQKVIAHVGSGSLYTSQKLGEIAAERSNISRVALLTPYYLPADPSQVIEHFHTYALANPDLSVYAYIFPDRTGVDVDPDTFRALMEPDNMVGAKISGSANRHLPDFVRALRPGQQLYTGDDKQMLTFRDSGATGVVSGCLPALPTAFITQGPELPNVETINSVVDLLGPSIARQKLALQLRTGQPWRSRMSMPSIPQEVSQAIDTLVADVGGGMQALKASTSSDTVMPSQ